MQPCLINILIRPFGNCVFSSRWGLDM